MSLITCDCGAKISEKLPVCPQCGTVFKKKMAKTMGKGCVIGLIMTLVPVIIVIGLLIFMFLSALQH